MLFSFLFLGLASADDGLNLLQIHAHAHSATQPAAAKSHNHGSAKWVPGSGYVLNKCGEGGNLADIRPDLAGWTGGDAYPVGSVKIDNAPTKEGCIENVLKDPRCQDKKAEIDARNNLPEYQARGKPYAYNLAASYAPGQGKCFCSWGTVESQKDGTGNPMSSGWITCIAKGGGKGPKVETPKDFVCDLCADSDNDFDPTGKRDKCKKINERAQKSVKACEKRKGRSGVQKRCCPDPPVECPLCPDGKEFMPDNLDGKCAKLASKATKNQEKCEAMKARKRPQRHCCVAPPVECPLCPDGQEFKPGNLNGKCEKLATKATKTEATCGKFKGQKRVGKCCEATKEKNDVVCTPESCPKTDDDKVKCGEGWTQGEGSGLALTRVVIGWPSAPLPNAAACVKAIKADPRCDDMDTVTYVDPEYTKAGKRDSTRLIGYCSCNGKVQLISAMEQYIACSLRRPWSGE